MRRTRPTSLQDAVLGRKGTGLNWLVDLLCGAALGKHKRSSHATLAGYLGLMALLSLFLTSLGHSRQLSRTSPRRSALLDVLFNDLAQRSSANAFNLTRAPEVVHLERRVDADALLGVCYHQRPMLEGMPPAACEDLQCLWVAELGLNIDLADTPLRVSPGPLEQGCPVPSGGQLPVPPDEDPHISYVVTMKNGPLFTARALLELFRTSREVPSAEYIVIDDGSDVDTSLVSETIWRLREIFHVAMHLERNEESVGYGLANGQGIRLARGKYVALINNDMYVGKGWLSAIMATFEAIPKAGIVGPMFMGDSDLITEAGGIVFRDADAWNYERGRPPSHNMYFMRRADYISAACVVFPRELYKEIGGFDPQYTRGYYEDTDIAFAVRAAGYEVIIQPLAVNFHQEGHTFGSTSELKTQLIAENKQKFLQKWHYALQDKHCPLNLDMDVSHLLDYNFFNGVDRVANPKLLWVDDIVPEPDRDSGSIRNLNLIRILLEAGYHITFAPTAGGREPHYSTRLRFMGVHVFPYMQPDTWMLQHKGRCFFDVILVARMAVFEMAQGQLAAHCPGVPIVYDTVYLHFLQQARDAITAQDDKKAWDFNGITTSRIVEWLEQPTPEAEKVRHTRDSELYFMNKSQLTLVVGPQEVQLLRQQFPGGRVAMVSNVHDMGQGLGETSCKGRAGVLFVGNMNHPPNRQAVEALITEILPGILEAMPQQLLRTFKVHVVGANIVSDRLKGMFVANKRFVTFHGHLSDSELQELYGQVKVAVAPLLSGAGVKGKVNQAMKYGVPVVATPVGVEGMFAADGVDCLVATSPPQFAEAVVRLHKDCKLWGRLVAGGRSNVAQHFSLDAARPALLEALASIGQGPLPESKKGECRGRATVPKKQE